MDEQNKGRYMLKPEQIEQIKLFDWLRTREDLIPFCLHVANERRVSPIHGRILKRMGVRAGVSDIFIGISRGKYHGMFLELKAGKNKPSKEQLQFMEDLSSQGYYCVWCQGYEAARELIENYLKMEKLYF